MDNELSANSNDQDERIKFRRQRIEARNISKDDAANKNNTQVTESKQTSRGQQQIADSLAHLDKRKGAGIDDVTSIRVEADAKENLRRIGEEERRQDRLRRLQEEAVLSGKRNAAVEMRWAELLDYNMPQDLLNEIDAQKASCGQIIESKDRLIKEFQAQLKGKDEEYVKSLKRQAEDVEAILERMSQQFKELQEEYEVELEQIEDAFLKERDELLASNKQEFDTLVDKNRTMLMQTMDAKLQREEEYQQEIEDLRNKDSEDYNKLKIKLQTDIQTLEQQLEEMRATYQLNTEKLEYNYRVLTERDMENSATLNQQKRKLTRLKDALSNLMQRYTQQDAESRHKNQELTEEYRRITKQYKDLQSKFRHFEIADNRRYREVWAMHEEELSEMVQKVLSADRIIHEQQLGMEWIDPMSVADNQTGVLSATQKGRGMSGGVGGGNSDDINDQSTLSNPDSDGSGFAPPQSAQAGGIQGKVAAAKVKKMLSMLASEAGFLVDAKVRNALEEMDDEKAAVVRADSLLKALGVETQGDVEKLLTYFFSEYDMPEHEDEEHNELMQLKSLDLCIQPDNVVQVIKQFVEDRSDRADSDSHSHGKKVSAATAMEQAAHDAEEARRERNRREEREFWERMANVIPEKTYRVWGALEKGLLKYNDILKGRADTIDSVSQLEQQNKELKSLLSQYLGARVNDDLIVPPTQMIRVEAPGSV
jgi:dynein regulatory complex protein 1